MATLYGFLIPAFTLVHVSALFEPCSLSESISFFSSDSCLAFDSVVSPSVGGDLLCVPAKTAQRISYLMRKKLYHSTHWRSSMDCGTFCF